MKLSNLIFFTLFLLLPLAVQASYFPEDCIACHAAKDGDSSLQIPLQEFNESAHGRNVTCTDCHNSVLNEEHMTDGAHAVDCSQCHPVESGATDYFSFLPSLRVKWHLKGDFSGNYNKKNCIGCHQGKASHGKEGAVDKQNCYVCHMKIKDNSVIANIHPVADQKKQPLIFASAVIYQILIVVILLSLTGFIFKKILGEKKGK
ncbi:MAG: hypothetical protein JW864_03090 [Spirochaetes bacterium]|nr:hypothetical protein [Spirochaetota bacterium]